MLSLPSRAMSSIAFCRWANACSCCVPISAHASSTRATCSSTSFFQTCCASRTCESLASLIVVLTFFVGAGDSRRFDGREAKPRGRGRQGKMLRCNNLRLPAALQGALQLVQLAAQSRDISAVAGARRGRGGRFVRCGMRRGRGLAAEGEVGPAEEEAGQGVGRGERDAREGVPGRDRGRALAGLEVE